MLEMLKERKAALEAQGKKGFTLMEMLIVIAIIAILIAIAIPLFTQQLQAAEDAADEANGRALYAALQADYMLAKADSTKTFTAPSGGKTVVYPTSGDSTTYTFHNGAAITGDSDTPPTVTVTLNNSKTKTFPESGASS